MRACGRQPDSRLDKIGRQSGDKGRGRWPLPSLRCGANASHLIPHLNSPLRLVRLLYEPRLQTQSSSPSLSLSQFAVQTARTKGRSQQRQAHPIPLPGAGPADVANQCFPPRPHPSIKEVTLGYEPQDWGHPFARSHGATLLRSGDPQGVCNAIVHAGREGAAAECFRENHLAESTSCPHKQREGEGEFSVYVKQKGLGKFSDRCEERREGGGRVAWQFIGLGRQMRRRETEQTMCFPRSIMRRVSGLGREGRRRGRKMAPRRRRRQIETYHRFETSFITPPQSPFPFTRLSLKCRVGRM